MRSLIIAAGGGGDAITAALLPPLLGQDAPAVVMTYSWDRLLIDPLPGPRSVRDFQGLAEVAPGVHEVLSTSRPIGGAGSSLPRLAAELPARLLLLDPTRGAVGMAEQMATTAQVLGFDELVLLDVGGDALTTGDDPGLRSPLADQLVIAAAARTGLPARLVIAGAGLDGEIPTEVVNERLAQLDATELSPLSGAAAVRNVFTWHPSEASGLLAAAADGRRGCVQVRDAGDQVRLTDETARLRGIGLDRVIHLVPAQHLLQVDSLDEAERTVHDLTRVSEIQYESAKANRRYGTSDPELSPECLNRLDNISEEALRYGVDYISTRRLAEVFGIVTLHAYSALCDLLKRCRSDRYEPSMYLVQGPLKW
ncbi:DUF1152 domain-containing protein [Pseudonocardia pini]|uniref:DUF1152 domain-containing protein n=1 Tax=Pseudonocardia pini TaxID=2758030 RepID=UPI0015EFDDE4|nr:DUF1152 domain-containing protein [Pseudonocardia pini]